MVNQVKNNIEYIIAKKIIRLLKKQMGEQMHMIITQIIGETIILRFKEILPPAERILTRNQQGLKLIKELKIKLIEKIKPLLMRTVEEVAKAKVIDIYSSFDLETNEHIEIFTLDKDLEKKNFKTK